MQINEALFAVIDTETTGLDPINDALVEIACVATHDRAIMSMWATLVNPGIAIPPEVSAIHYLTNKDVEHAPSAPDAINDLVQFADDTDCVCAVAHNAAFDSGFINRDTGSPFHFICTKRLAQHIWPDAPTFKNQGLRFWRELKVDTFGILPHRALADALVTAALLRDMLASEEFAATGIDTVEGLLDLSNAPICYKTWPLGKYKGKPILDAPSDYIAWAQQNITDDPDLTYTLGLALKGELR